MEIVHFTQAEDPLHCQRCGHPIPPALEVGYFGWWTKKGPHGQMCKAKERLCDISEKYPPKSMRPRSTKEQARYESMLRHPSNAKWDAYSDDDPEPA